MAHGRGTIGSTDKKAGLMGRPVFWAVLGTAIATMACPARANGAPADEIELPAWQTPGRVDAVPFAIGAGAPGFAIWGGGAGQRHYFAERLPALFERTLLLESLGADAELAWMFTGPHGGFTVTVRPQQVELVQRYYDSPALNEVAGGKPPRHPEWKTPVAALAFRGRLQAVTVVLDHKLGLSVALNGRETLRQTCWLDVSRHQLRLAGNDGVAGKLLVPQAAPAGVRIDPARRHQTMVGFGGITTPTAYAQLSAEGKRRWWQLVCEHNLLIQREYPNGQRLNPAMDNWDRLADATPHYYGDNFPNGEISDFSYNRTLRALGGKVWFEFWALPPWVGTDADKYADTMARYCQVSREKAGAPPDVVGIQNEVQQTAEQWRAMTLALRRKLDQAGFASVRIHMSDDGSLAGGIRRAEAFRRWPEVWRAIDYSATHMYDYQKHFTDPDGFDSTLLRWKEVAGNKPFLSTELCINDSRYQLPSYRIALLMGQLYHKNLVITDAAAICYCWTLLNVEQPSYGWTRSLCVPDAENGFLPKASSHQLRVLGAYSRRIREGMTRVEAVSSSGDLLASAFEGPEGRRTVVLLNRSNQPIAATIAWPGGRLAQMEVADPYWPNAIRPAPAAGPLRIEPGSIVTVTSTPLGQLPPGWPRSDT